MSMTIEEINKQVLENPLTKEEAKKQFVEKTEEYGLKHAYTFEEAWEVSEELKRRRECRNQLQILSDAFLKADGIITGEEASKINPVQHSFADGCYIRQIFNPAGQLIVTKIHKKKHPFFLMVGEMSVLTEEGVEYLKAPYFSVTEPGTKRFIYTHTDCIFVTVHATEETDIKKIEEEVIAKDYNDPEISLDQINLLKQKI